jgi:hypothetical protein
VGLLRLLACGASALLIAGCAGNVSTERDAVGYYVWSQRGQTVGEYARLFCTRAAEQHRQVFRWGVEQAAGGARVIIACPLTGPTSRE